MTGDFEEENWESRSKRYRANQYGPGQGPGPARQGTQFYRTPRYVPRTRETSPYNDYDDSELTLPYVSDEENDDGDFSTNNNSRFLDSGWGGECLQDTEDIDFELVYALHTFVATVDGQANATKGDAMVLLDDSNSYWWLVRVVKDASIGMLMRQLLSKVQ